MAKMKAMISQPMGGKTVEEINEIRGHAIEELTKRGYEVVDTYFTGEEYSDSALAEQGIVQLPLYFLAKSLEAMSLCQAVYFCRGWEEARGCRSEHETAKAFGVGIFYDW